MKPMGIFFSLIGLLIAVFVCAWLFNHMSAWIGILSALIIAGTTLYFITKQLNKS